MRKYIYGLIASFVVLMGGSHAQSANQYFEYQLTIPPGATFIANFLMSKDTSVAVKLSNTKEILLTGFAHPSSELVQRDGQLSVQCAGIGTHQIKVTGETSGDNMTILARDLGHYGIALQNRGKEPLDVDLSLLPSSPSQFVFTGTNASAYSRAK